MFKLKEKAFSAPPELNGPAAPPLPAKVPHLPASEAAGGLSVFARDLLILGEKITIISQGKLQVDGRITGDVHGKEVVIGEGGSVVGEVWAERIDVRGEVRGSMIAVALVLHASAKVAGNVMQQKLTVSEGAELDASIRLIRDPAELMPILDAEALARGRGEAERTHEASAASSAWPSLVKAG